MARPKKEIAGDGEALKSVEAALELHDMAQHGVDVLPAIEEAIAPAPVAAPSEDGEPVIAIYPNGWRAWLPENVAKDNLAQGIIIAIER